jgi:putative transposase
VEYIHYNPVKHGLAGSAAAWKYSSFMKYVRDGFYPLDWGGDGKIFSGESWME